MGPLVFMLYYGDRMSCYSPLKAFKLLNEETPNGKAEIVFNRKLLAHKAYTPIDIPCGQCLGCRIDRSRQWAVRCVHEASFYDYNCFVTLTYDDAHLPDDYSINKRDFCLFIKTLRKHYNGFKAVVRPNGKIGYPIRYYMCGEYGDKSYRPHYHACLFNFDFIDKQHYKSQNGVKLYISDTLNKLWGKGYCTIGDVTFQSAAYVARYIMKKVNGKPAKNHYRRVDTDTGEVWSVEPEYNSMSLRPGIGGDWVKQFKKDLEKDYITIQGRKFRLPKYYDNLLDRWSPEVYDELKTKRRRYAQKTESDDSLRLLQRKRCKELQIRKLKRGLDNDY